VVGREKWLGPLSISLYLGGEGKFYSFIVDDFDVCKGIIELD